MRPPSGCLPGLPVTSIFNLHIVRQGEAGELESRVSETLDRLHGLGCEGVVEDLIGDSLTLASLPFGYDPANDRFVMRERRWPSDNFSDALPGFRRLARYGEAEYSLFQQAGRAYFF